MPVRPALLAAAFALFWVGAAQAQSPWPAAGGTAAPPAGASPWPATGNAAPPSGPSPFPPAGTNASPFPPAGTNASPFPQQQQQQQRQPPAVCNNFIELRTAAEKGAIAIRTASQRKAAQPEICNLFKSYNSTEAKMLKFLQDNQSTCGIPDQAITQVKASHAKTTQIRNQVCNPQAAAPGGRAKPPSLGDALGTPAVPSGENTKTGRGTYDTLTGSNPLAR